MPNAQEAAPTWFGQALADPPERTRLPVNGAGIEMLRWRRPGKPGLLLIHGMCAHADWWSFIAPLLAEQFSVACFSLSGMGGSGWRETYSIDDYAAEARACMEWGELFSGPTRPIVLGHSFGGMTALRCGDLLGPRLAAVVVADTYYLPASSKGRDGFGVPGVRYQPDAEGLIARFRLMPEQPCAPWLMRYLAETSIVEDPGRGWRWRFDPDVMTRAARSDVRVLVGGLRCPLAVMRGALSELVPRAMMEQLAAEAEGAVPTVEIPEARHHLFLDQPIAFVAALRALLAAWPGADGDRGWIARQE